MLNKNILQIYHQIRTALWTHLCTGNLRFHDGPMAFILAKSAEVVGAAVHVCDLALVADSETEVLRACVELCAEVDGISPSEIGDPPTVSVNLGPGRGTSAGDT